MRQTPLCLPKPVGPAIPWFGGTEDSSTCTGGTFVADPGVCPCSWDLYLRGRKLNNRVCDAPGELLSLNPLSPAVWRTTGASETPPLTSPNNARNLKQPKTKAKQNKRTRRKERGGKKKKAQMGAEIRREPPDSVPSSCLPGSSQPPGPVRMKQFAP